MNIVICGHPFTGKLALVNSIVGKEISEEGATAEPVVVHSFTCDVKGLTLSIKVVHIPRHRSFDEHEAQLVVEEYREADVLLYCIRMKIRGYWGVDVQADCEGIRDLTNHFGPDIWKNAVFAFTFANDDLPPMIHRVSIFKMIFQQCKTNLIRFLRKDLLLPEGIVSDISIVPTGYRQHPPPDRKDWLSPLWSEITQKAKLPRGTLYSSIFQNSNLLLQCSIIIRSVSKLY